MRIIVNLNSIKRRTDSIRRREKRQEKNQCLFSYRWANCERLTFFWCCRLAWWPSNMISLLEYSKRMGDEFFDRHRQRNDCSRWRITRKRRTWWWKSNRDETCRFDVQFVNLLFDSSSFFLANSRITKWSLSLRTLSESFSFSLSLSLVKSIILH